MEYAFDRLRCKNSQSAFGILSFVVILVLVCLIEGTEGKFTHVFIYTPYSPHSSFFTYRLPLPPSFIPFASSPSFLLYPSLLHVSMDGVGYKRSCLSCLFYFSRSWHKEDHWHDFTHTRLYYLVHEKQNLKIYFLQHESILKMVNNGFTRAPYLLPAKHTHTHILIPKSNYGHGSPPSPPVLLVTHMQTSSASRVWQRVAVSHSPTRFTDFLLTPWSSAVGPHHHRIPVEIFHLYQK